MQNICLLSRKGISRGCLNGNVAKIARCLWAMQLLPWLGFEPRLLRPQRRVLTTIRSRQAMEKHLHLGFTSALFSGTSIPVIHRNRHFVSCLYLEMPSQLIALSSPPFSNILLLANKPKGTKIVSLCAIFQTWWLLSGLLTLVESLLSLPLLIHAHFLLSFTKRGPQTSSYGTGRVVASKWILLIPIFGQTGQNLRVLAV